MVSSPRYTHGHAESVLRSHRTRTAENSAAWRGWAAYSDGWFSVPHGEILVRV